MMGGWRSALALAIALTGCIGGAEDAAPEDMDAPPNGADATIAPAATVAPDTNATSAAPPVQIELHVTSTGFYPVNPAFESDTTEIPTGAVVTVTYHNEDLNPLGKHDWVLEGVEGAATAQVEVGEEAMGRFVAPAPGAYAYFCSVEGHRGAGMEGTLTIV